MFVWRERSCWGGSGNRQHKGEVIYENYLDRSDLQNGTAGLLKVPQLTQRSSGWKATVPFPHHCPWANSIISRVCVLRTKMELGRRIKALSTWPVLLPGPLLSTLLSLSSSCEPSSPPAHTMPFPVSPSTTASSPTLLEHCKTGLYTSLNWLPVPSRESQPGILAPGTAWKNTHSKNILGLN